MSESTQEKDGEISSSAPPKEEEINHEEAVRLRIGGYVRFLRSGGVVTLSEFLRLSLVDRDALEAAGEVVSIERASRIVELLEAKNPSSSAPPKDKDDAMERAAREAISLTGGAS